jgi:hypothetical protein
VNPVLRGEAAIVGVAQLPAERPPRRPRRFSLEQWADLAARAQRTPASGPGRSTALLFLDYGDAVLATGRLGADDLRPVVGVDQKLLGGDVHHRVA